MLLAEKPVIKRMISFQVAPLSIGKGFNIRGADEPGSGRHIVGLIPYNSRSLDLGGFVEVVTPTAFAETLRQGFDVKALFAHDMGRPLGRVKNGTLILKDTPQGLECRAFLPNTSYANDLLELVKRGDCTTMSFGFNKGESREKNENGKTVSYLTSVNLLEVSFGVIFPAYEETKVSISSSGRSVQPGALERYLSSLPTEEIVKLHKIYCGGSSKNEQADTASDFLKSLLGAAKARY